MDVSFSTLCIFLGFLAFVRVDARLRNSVSVIALPFRYHGISPEYVDPAPRQMCQVKWPSGATARLGNVLTPLETVVKPNVEWDCDIRQRYSIFLFDLDVLGRANRLVDEGRLWFVANITYCNLSYGETVVDLLPPTPLYGSGLHRYVILVYKQDQHVYYEEPFVAADDTDHRFYTTMQKFSVKYSLGRPVCGNFFLAEWDESVDSTFGTLKRPFPVYITRALAEAKLPTN